MSPQQQFETIMSEILLEIFERVRSYKILKWQYISPTLPDPYQLASVGYQCQETGTLSCQICHHSVQLMTRDGDVRDEQEVKADVLNHRENCFFAKQEYRNIQASELYLQIDSLTETIRRSYAQNFKDKNPVNLPVLDSQAIWDCIESANRKQTITTIMKCHQVGEHNYNISFMLELFGWKIHPHADKLQCLFCSRDINLNELHRVSDNKQPSDYQGKDIFDPISQHRYFCLWVHGVRGWQLCLQHLYDKIGEAKEIFPRINPQEVGKIRVHIDKYLQNFVSNLQGQFSSINKTMEDCENICTLLENEGQQTNKIRQDFQSRKKEFKDFVENIEIGIKQPLKKIKLD